MRHNWIFDVLDDLRRYSAANGLPGLALKVDEAIQVAKRELALAPPSKDLAQDGPPGSV